MKFKILHEEVHSLKNQLNNYKKDREVLPLNYRINAFDIETDAPTGNAFLICDADGHKWMTRKGEFLTTFQMIDFLFSHGTSIHEYRINFLHNIDFDRDATF